MRRGRGRVRTRTRPRLPCPRRRDLKKHLLMFLFCMVVPFFPRCAPTAVVTGHMDGMIRVWILQLDAKPQPQPLAPVACREEKDKEETEDEQPSLPNVLTCMAELYYPYPRDIRPPITAVVMSPDQKRFYTGDAQGTVLSWSSYQIPTK